MKSLLILFLAFVAVVNSDIVDVENKDFETDMLNNIITICLSGNPLDPALSSLLTQLLQLFNGIGIRSISIRDGIASQIQNLFNTYQDHIRQVLRSVIALIQSLISNPLLKNINEN